MMSKTWTIAVVLLIVALAVPTGAGEPPAGDELETIILEQAPGLRSHVLRLGLQAYGAVQQQGLVRRERLTIIDYELPSYEKRLWVIDVRTGDVLLHDWVTHGMGRPEDPGGDHERVLAFSNEVGTRKSCLGALLTAETYHGKHGYSLRLDGLEPGVNDAARERYIVIHGADYVREDLAAARKVGRSWGCPAVRYEVSTRFIDHIRGGSVVWGYYPDHGWLSSSVLLPRQPGQAGALGGVAAR